MLEESDNKRYLHKNDSFYPKEKHFIVSLLQYGRHEHTITSWTSKSAILNLISLILGFLQIARIYQNLILKLNHTAPKLRHELRFKIEIHIKMLKLQDTIRNWTTCCYKNKSVTGKTSSLGWCGKWQRLVTIAWILFSLQSKQDWRSVLSRTHQSI